MEFRSWIIATDEQSHGLGILTNSASGSATAAAERPLCRCLRVTETAILEAIDQHEPETVQGVSRVCGAGSGCMSCHRHIRRMLGERAACRRSAPLTVE